LSARYHIYIILKGAYTGISTPEGQYYFNTTGNPGMATGGSGDVLTGLIAGLLSQGMTAMQAAIYGVHIHGMAGDLVLESSSEESLIARDIIHLLGKAIKNIKEKPLMGMPGRKKVIE
jgi:NAD(P)H-hydrate epimerase